MSARRPLSTSVWPVWGGGWRWNVTLNGSTGRSGFANSKREADQAIIRAIHRLRERAAA